MTTPDALPPPPAPILEAVKAIDDVLEGGASVLPNPDIVTGSATPSILKSKYFWITIIGGIAVFYWLYKKGEQHEREIESKYIAKTNSSASSSSFPTSDARAIESAGVKSAPAGLFSSNK